MLCERLKYILLLLPCLVFAENYDRDILEAMSISEKAIREEGFVVESPQITSKNSDLNEFVRSNKPENQLEYENLEQVKNSYSGDINSKVKDSDPVYNKLQNLKKNKSSDQTEASDLLTNSRVEAQKYRTSKEQILSKVGSEDKDKDEVGLETKHVCTEDVPGLLANCKKKLIVIAIPQPDLVKVIDLKTTGEKRFGHGFNMRSSSSGSKEEEKRNWKGKKRRYFMGSWHLSELYTHHYNPSKIELLSKSRGLNLSIKNCDVHFQRIESGEQSAKIRLTIPQLPLLKHHWEGCEELEAKEKSRECLLIQQENLFENQERMIKPYPYPVKPALVSPGYQYWVESKNYSCGNKSKTYACDVYRKNACKQIKSTCISKKDGRCQVYQYEFLCRPSSTKNDSIPTTDFDHGIKPREVDDYGAKDFGYTMAHYSAMKEFNNTGMQDGLGGISSPEDNPRIFHGKGQQCKRILGHGVLDCCNLEGILRGVLSCSAAEKELAVATIRNKRCHYVGEYCAKKVLGKCVKRKKSYCCYGSHLAKIIQEIAHEQLSLSWGEPKYLNCPSISASDLSRLDFDTPSAQAKLGEFIDEFKEQAAVKTKEMREKLERDGAANLADPGRHEENAKALSEKLKAKFGSKSDLNVK
ncbi:MAG: conjugal transfer protein TraN [Gammaproteobacteria bacterium]